MTQKEFIYYVKGIIDSEIENGQVDAFRANISNADINLIGPLKLIKDALDSLQEEPIQTTKFTTPQSDLVPYFETCACNPKNGGSGICGCTIGNNMVPKDFLYKETITTTKTDIKL
jgi:hypothetical protein